MRLVLDDATQKLVDAQCTHSGGTGNEAPQTTMASGECHSNPATRLTFSSCSHAVFAENSPRARLRPRHGRAPVTVGQRHFGYWRDPACVIACGLYVGYRWLIPALGYAPLWNGHVTDVLLIPAGLPIWLWLERRAGWRRGDRMPMWSDIAFALVVWTVAAEVMAPFLFSRATGDVWDAAAYACGAVVAGLFWQWRAGAGSSYPQLAAPATSPRSALARA